MAAGEVTRIVLRCQQASEDGKLDLSNCLLTAFPDAVFHLTRQTTITSCDLSNNQLKRLPAKFTKNFPHLAELDLSANKLESLPEGFLELSDLQTLDVSSNNLTVFPMNLVSNLPQLQLLNLHNNCITDLNEQSFTTTASKVLAEINLELNPLSNDSRTILAEVTGIVVRTSDPADKLDTMD